jgi:hypothetical protein
MKRGSYQPFYTRLIGLSAVFLEVAGRDLLLMDEGSGLLIPKGILLVLSVESRTAVGIT